MKLKILALYIAAGTALLPAQQHAKNVILFLGDAGGIPTLNVASIRTYNAPQKLFIQHMPHLALSDTSSTSSWVTDSAAGMTAIVTGQKTDNGVISETPARDGKEGERLKTILEYAEEHGLSTGVVTNMPIADATPAACYAHAKSRKMFGEIFSQVWKPKYGDGVDVVFGAGRKAVEPAVKALGFDMEKELRASGRPVYASLEDVPATAKRAVVVLDGDFKVDLATQKAIQILSKNPKGFFLMVEWDMHPTNPVKGLDNVVGCDRLVARTVKEMNPKNTLVIFTADHSFNLRLIGGKRGVQPTLPSAANNSEKTDVAIGKEHSGEEVLVAAQGPGSERVKGFIPNTDLFRIMLSAFGWSGTQTK
ncbi:MAG: alkaline phosphatase [Acidobacteria bacterium]|nr:alkaline phosphatase [Acidobacteriota bacterium]